jgi:hypothetical protein
MRSTVLFKENEEKNAIESSVSISLILIFSIGKITGRIIIRSMKESKTR